MNEQKYDPISMDIDIMYRSERFAFRHFHSHNAVEIYLFLKGDAKFCTEHNILQMYPGTLLMIPSDTNHKAELLSPEVYERYTLNISNRLLNHYSTLTSNLSHCFITNENADINYLQLSKENLETMLSLFRELDAAVNASDSSVFGYDLASAAGMIRLLVFINRLMVKETPAGMPCIPLVVRDTMKYIDEHLTESINISDLSKQLYHNNSYISRIFKKNIGQSIRQYIIQKRIFVAAQHLKDGKSVSESSSLSGFGNYSNFSRTFTNIVGCSPKKYQMDIRKYLIDRIDTQTQKVSSSPIMENETYDTDS